MAHTTHKAPFHSVSTMKNSLLLSVALTFASIGSLSAAETCAKSCEKASMKTSAKKECCASASSCSKATAKAKKNNAASIKEIAMR